MLQEVDITDDTYKHYLDKLKFTKGNTGLVKEDYKIRENNNHLYDNKYETYYIKNYLNPNKLSSEFLVQDTKDNRLFKLLVFGEKDTPYENCGFIFNIFVPDTFPSTPPIIQYYKDLPDAQLTPYIFKDSVKLPILGNYLNYFPKWNPNNTLYDIIIAIKSMFTHKNPFFSNIITYNNKKTRSKLLEADNYNHRVKLISIKEGIINLLKNKEECFNRIILLHFLIKYDDLITQLNNWENEEFNPESIEYSKYNSQSIDNLIIEAKDLLNKFYDSHITQN